MSYSADLNDLCSVTQEDFNRRARAALRAFMHSERLTNKHVAQAVGCHPNTITNILNGGAMSAYMIAQLGVLFGAVWWVAVYNDFGVAMKKRYERKTASERQALHEWSFLTQTGTGD